ncbi:MAG TPA: zinc-binding dehydrogenase [Candidatus Deferrimicrobium sp.]|nr:zinc-binding dehydrogenase [Candidatus Deferrimicrobium sp.]
MSAVLPGEVDGPVPTEMRAAVLDGTGTGHLSVRRVPVPRPGAAQLLARVDAAGICTSVNKLLDQGPEHPLMHGWNPVAHPVIVGDEGVVTLVEAGESLRDRYRPGLRFAVQPAVDIAPIQHLDRYRDHGRGVAKIAVGYTLPGLLAEYILIGEEVLAAGCFLPLPDDDLPSAHAAIAEPISCIISSHAHHVHLTQPDRRQPRVASSGLLPGGITVVIGAGPMGRIHVDLALAARPRVIIATARRADRLDWLRRTFGDRARQLGVHLELVDTAQADLAAVVERLSEGHGADDVIVTAADREVVEAAQRLLARYGVLDLFAGLPPGSEHVAIDARFVHYQEVNITGSSGGGPWDILETLRLMTEGQIDAGAHIAHIGDLEHAPELLRMARQREVAGKAVVYPHRRSEAIATVPRWDGEDERRYLAAG